MSKRLFDSLGLSSDSNKFSRFRPPPCPASSVRLFRMVSMGYSSIKLRLETFPLETCPEYIALSYTWDPRPRYMKDTTGKPNQNLTDPNESIGSDFVSVPVEINSCPYMISRHLAGGLHALDRFRKGRQTMPISQPLSATIPDTLWIFVDAICICQDDNDDKATQIANMHKIFGQAKTVFVWLGRALYNIPNERKGKDGIQIGECLHEIPSLIKEMKDCIQNSKQSAQSLGESTQQPSDDFLPSKLRHTNKRLWHCLSCMVSIPWWERLWVVQEVALARRVIIMCSRFALPWDTYIEFLKLSGVLHLVPDLLPRLPESFRLLFGRVYNDRAVLIDQLKHEASEEVQEKVSKRQMKNLLDVVRNSFVLQPLDRVYAILGLLGTGVRERVHIDYSDEARQTYRLKWIEVCQIILATDPSLASSLFLLASYLARREEIPSWCPNLEDNRSIPAAGIHCDSYVAGMVGSQTTGTLPAKQTGEVPKIMPIPGTSGISASGIQIDQIAHTEDFSWITDVLESDIDTIREKKSILSVLMLEALSKCTEALEKAMPSGENHELIVARCLVGNTYESEPPRTLAQDYQAFKDWLQNICDESTTESYEEHLFLADVPHYGSQFLYFVPHCSFFITEFGRPGVMTNKVTEGDHVCLLIGLGAPYVLREKSDNTTSTTIKSYELVGEAYVDGIMNGEAISSLGPIDDRMEEFRIE